MPSGFLWQQFLFHLVDAAPWLIAILGGLAILNFGPLGRALRARLQGPNRADLEERLEELRSELASANERLDYLERLAVQRPGAVALPPAAEPTTPV